MRNRLTSLDRSFIVNFIVIFLPNNTTKCRRTYTSSRAGQQGPTRTLTAAPKRSLKQLLDAFNYYTQVNITNKKTKKINVLLENI